MKINVFFPFTVLIPWTNFPSSFAKDCSHFFLSLTLTICLYSWGNTDIWWLTVLASLTCSNFSVNANFGTEFFLQLDIKLELVTPVSTLWGCTVLTLGGGTGTSRRMMCGPEGDILKVRWRSVGLFPSSSSMMLVRSAGISLARAGRTLWEVGEDLVTGCFCGGSRVVADGLQSWKKYLRVAQWLTYGSFQC